MQGVAAHSERMDLGQIVSLLIDPDFILAVIGGGSAVAAFLRQVLPSLEQYAASTATDADNAAVDWLTNALRLFTAALDAAKKLADVVGLNERPAKREWSEPAEVLIDVDGDQSSDGSL